MTNTETSGKVKVLKKVPNTLKGDHKIEVNCFLDRHNSYYDDNDGKIKQYQSLLDKQQWGRNELVRDVTVAKKDNISRLFPDYDIYKPTRAENLQKICNET